MLKQLDQIHQDALAALKSIADQEGLLDWRSSYIGRKSPLMEIFTKMRELSKEEKPLVILLSILK